MKIKVKNKLVLVILSVVESVVEIPLLDLGYYSRIDYERIISEIVNQNHDIIPSEREGRTQILL